MSGNEDALWAKVMARDPTADGSFYFGVMTTGVYCRPSCAGGRRAKRENVRFFKTPEAAEAAGLRACLRCRPKAEEVDAGIAAARQLIEARADEALPLARLAAVAGMSPGHFQRRFKAIVGVSPKAYQDGLRLKGLKARLKAQDSVAGAIFEAGYGSTSRLYERLDGALGMTPSAYRAGGAGEEIAYATRETALGPLLMAATARGVCFVQFGESAGELQAQLRKEYPNAELKPSPAAGALDAWMEALDRHLSGAGPRPDMPLDLQGTGFQLKVWRFLQSVREGEAVSYAEVAAGIGAPKAVRAAASACARNRIAVLIPCHRVLRGDGALGGYRWGLERKRALLDAERKRRGGS